ncbi:heterogeneous nuclear ribonucleoprotein L, partial [Clonorchis sinensis]
VQTAIARCSEYTTQSVHLEAMDNFHFPEITSHRISVLNCIVDTLKTVLQLRYLGCPCDVVSGENLVNLEYADDIILIFEDEGGGQTLLNRPITVIPCFGMRLAPSKCKIMLQNVQSTDISLKSRRISVGYGEFYITRFSDEPLRIGEHSIDVSFSTSRHVMQRASSKETSPDPSDPLSTVNHVLLYTVFNVQHPVTLKVIHQITSMFAEVVRIVMFRKSNIQAMVEFKSVEDARRVKQNLNGADIYSGCCTLKVDYARPTRLTVKRNDEDTWDFENNNAADAEPDDSVGSSRRMHGSLLGSYYEHDMRPPHANGSFHTPCFQTPPGRSLMRLPTTPDSSRYHPHPPTPVAMVFNLNPDEMNCERFLVEPTKIHNVHSINRPKKQSVKQYEEKTERQSAHKNAVWRTVQLFLAREVCTPRFSKMAPGADGQYSAPFNEGGEVPVNNLTTKLRKVPDENRTPMERSASTFIPVLKKGAKTTRENHRVISLAANTFKNHADAYEPSAELIMSNEIFVNIRIDLDGHNRCIRKLMCPGPGAPNKRTSIRLDECVTSRLRTKEGIP